MVFLVGFGVLVVALTELLGAFGLLRFGPLSIAWGLVIAGIAVVVVRRPGWKLLRPAPALGWLGWTCLAAMGSITVLIGMIAVISPPNSADAMAYHMPRVIYWAQAASVSFFPTPYLNQVMLQPFAEYVMLHTYVLSGGDRFVNLVAFFASVGCLIGVSEIARLFGAGPRGRIFAALFCATLPNGILQASGAKNDYVLALWLVAAAYFGKRFSITAARSDAWAMGAAAGLALLTKATAYLFLPGVLVAVLVPKALPNTRRLAVPLIAGILLLNGLHYARNFALSGSPLGFDSAHGDGAFRWRNERLGLRPALSNLLRHLSDQVGDRRKSWNRTVHGFVLRAHAWMGADPEDPATTWRWTRYEAPRNANHEANANNRWHLLLIAMTAAAALLRGYRELAIYFAGLLLAFVAFCFYLKWQPFLSRLLLPLFVLAAPGVAMMLEKIRPVLAQAAVCLFLIANTRLPLTENWTRPLEGPNSILRASRQDQYFADMAPWNNKRAYLGAVDAILTSRCDTVGIDISRYELEYPLQALLRQRRPEVRFVHVGIGKEPRRPPCAIVCLECAGSEEKRREHQEVGAPAEVGTFLVFLPAP